MKGLSIGFTASKGPGILLSLLLIASCSPKTGEQDLGPLRHTVEIKGFQFSPAVLSVSPGDTVVWINRDFVPHTATDKQGTWDSEMLEEDDSWEMVVDKAYAYYCVYHPEMIGRIEVR